MSIPVASWSLPTFKSLLLNWSTCALSTNKKFLVWSRPASIWSLVLTESARAWLNFSAFLYKSLYKASGSSISILLRCSLCLFDVLEFLDHFQRTISFSHAPSEKFPRLSIQAKIEHLQSSRHVQYPFEARTVNKGTWSKNRSILTDHSHNNCMRRGLICLLCSMSARATVTRYFRTSLSVKPRLDRNWRFFPSRQCSASLGIMTVRYSEQLSWRISILTVWQLPRSNVGRINDGVSFNTAYIVNLDNFPGQRTECKTRHARRNFGHGHNTRSIPSWSFDEVANNYVKTNATNLREELCLVFVACNSQVLKNMLK